MSRLELWLKAMKVGEIWGCHQRADRSFFVKGWQFPLCARCTGVVIGQTVGTFVALKRKFPLKTAFAGCYAMLFDWTLQYLKIKESTNKRRFLTGIAGGFGLVIFWGRILSSLSSAVRKERLKSYRRLDN